MHPERLSTLLDLLWKQGKCLAGEIMTYNTFDRKDLLHWKLHFLTALAASQDNLEQTYKTLHQALLEAKDDAILNVRPQASFDFIMQIPMSKLHKTLCA